MSRLPIPPSDLQTRERFASLVSMAMEERCLRFSDVMARTGLSSSTLGNVLRPQHESLSLLTMLRVVEALGYDLVLHLRDR